MAGEHLIQLLLTNKMEIFRQLVWTPDYTVLGEVPALQSAWEAPDYPDMEVSFSDIPMANYPPPSPLPEVSSLTYVDLDRGYTVHIEDLPRTVDSFDPENLSAGKVCYIYF